MNWGRWIGAALLALGLAQHGVRADDFSRGSTAYRHGHYDEAHDLLKPLALAGDPFAQYSIAVMYDDGRGVPKNLKLAHTWYLRAARNGLVDAQFMAGMFYAVGRGRAQDLVRAYIWLDLAAAGGFPHAERARDQEMGEMTPADLHRAQAMAVEWQHKQPRQMSCRGRFCIYPGWLDKPAYGLFD
jgi:uncharacterized protein